MIQSALRRSCRNWCARVLVAVSVAGCASAIAEAVVDRPVLTPWQTLPGARLLQPPALAFGPLPKAGSAGYLAFLSPAALAVRNRLIYLVDEGHRRIFRYDPAQSGIARFSDHAVASVAALAVAPDMSLYVTDTDARRVLHFSQDGRLLRAFSDEHALARPVALVVDDATGQLLVADSLYNHVVVFNSLGRALGTIQSLEARGIDAMARGPDGLYLVDRLSRQVVVMATDGTDLYTIGAGILKHPGAIAVDRYNRVFVSDSFDNTIKVFEQGRLAASYGGAGAVAGFNRIAGMALDHDTLYVADSLNSRLRIFHVLPPAVPE